MKIKRILMAAAAGTALFAAACETTQATGSGDAATRAAEAERRAAAAESRAAALEAQLAGGTASTASMSGDAIASAAGYPVDADAGQCFARILVPEMTQVVTESVVDTPERSEIKVIPATYDLVEETVLIREESIEYSVVPATYQTVTEQVLIEEEKREVVVIPAQFEEYEEQVLVRAAYTTWKPGEGLFGRADAVGGDGVTALPTGEILCKVEVPAQYRTVTRTRMVSPERTEETVIPARYETITKEVIANPPEVVERVIPAQYETIKVRRMVTAPREETIVVPASMRTVERTQVVGGGQLEWREVLCDTNATPETIAQIQSALVERGYSTGRADGVFGPSTLRSMEAFQRDNGLVVGQLTRETVEALGVPFVAVIR